MDIETDLKPMGLIEIAAALGVERSTADQWQTRGVLPAPRWTVGGRPAWATVDVAQFAFRTKRWPGKGIDDLALSTEGIASAVGLSPKTFLDDRKLRLEAGERLEDGSWVWGMREVLAGLARNGTLGGRDVLGGLADLLTARTLEVASVDELQPETVRRRFTGRWVSGTALTTDGGLTVVGPILRREEIDPESGVGSANRWVAVAPQSWGVLAGELLIGHQGGRAGARLAINSALAAVAGIVGAHQERGDILAERVKAIPATGGTMFTLDPKHALLRDPERPRP